MERVIKTPKFSSLEFILINIIFIAVLTALPAFAANDGVDIVDGFLRDFKNRTQIIAESFYTAARYLFWSLATIQFGYAAISLGRKGDLNFNSAIELLIREVMLIGFFLFLLENYTELGKWIVTSFTKLGTNSTGIAELTPSTILGKGIETFWRCMSVAFKMGIWNGLTAVIPCFIMLLAFSIGAAHAAVILVEYYLVVPVGVIFLGAGGSLWTKNYAESYIKLLISVGVKMLCLQIILGIAVLYMGSFVKSVEAREQAVQQHNIERALNKRGKKHTNGNIRGRHTGSRYNYQIQDESKTSTTTGSTPSSADITPSDTPSADLGINLNGTGKDEDFVQGVSSLAAVAIVMCLAIKQVPQFAASAISGSSFGSGSMLTSAMGAAAGAVMGAAGMTMRAADAAKDASAAVSDAAGGGGGSISGAADASSGGSSGGGGSGGGDSSGGGGRLPSVLSSSGALASSGGSSGSADTGGGGAGESGGGGDAGEASSSGSQQEPSGNNSAQGSGSGDGQEAVPASSNQQTAAQAATTGKDINSIQRRMAAKAAIRSALGLRPMSGRMELAVKNLKNNRNSGPGNIMGAEPSWQTAARKTFSQGS